MNTRCSGSLVPEKSRRLRHSCSSSGPIILASLIPRRCLAPARVAEVLAPCSELSTEVLRPGPSASLLATGWRCRPRYWKSHHGTEANPSLPGCPASSALAGGSLPCAPSLAATRRGVLDHARLGRLVSAHRSDPSPTRPLGGFGMTCPGCQQDNPLHADFAWRAVFPSGPNQRACHPGAQGGSRGRIALERAVSTRAAPRPSHLRRD